MSVHIQNLVKLSALVKTNKVVTSRINRSASSVQRIIKFKDKNGGNLSFSKLSCNNTFKIINKVVAPAFLTDANYNYLYPNMKDRKLAVLDRFNNLIPTVNASKSVNSYTLFDDDKQEPIGHVLLYAPMPETETKAEASETDSHEDTGRKFSRQLLKVSNKMSAAMKMLYLSKAMKNEYALINDIISCGYWEISCVSINPIIQSAGYGTLIMNNIHNIIRKKNEKTTSTYNIPTILFTSTPSALRFYQRLGYQLFMEHNINNDITSYSLIYHSDEIVLKLWMDHLKKNVQYYHKVDRFSFMPTYIRSLINVNKNEQEENINHECIFNTPQLDYYFEYE